MIALSRERIPELMDEPAVDSAELARSLADLRGANRWLGGTRVVIRELAPILRRLRGEEIRLLDVGTGSADLPLAVARWAAGEGIRLRVVATDAHPATVAEARALVEGNDNVEVMRADALSLSFPDASFHVAMCHTALHHFDPADAVRVLRELGRVASAAVVVTDLRRSIGGLLGARLLAVTVWRGHPITRHDGPRSVRASFTPGELRRLASEAGLREGRVRTHPLFRQALVVDRTDGRG